MRYAKTERMAAQCDSSIDSAGADCIDCAADPSIVAAVDEGIRAAQQLCPHMPRPWIMVSINDDADPHFRKVRRR